jgi:hypothetical protein
MPQPRFLIDELPLLMRGKSLDERSGQRMIAHVVQGRAVDHIVGVTGTQQVEEVQTTLAARRAEPGERVVADLLVWTAPDGIDVPE